MSTTTRSVTYLTFALGFGLSAAWPMLSCKKSDETEVKVLGGTTGDDQFPQSLLVLMFNSSKQPLGSCTGSFIRHDTLITAAHCFVETNATYVEVVSPTGPFKDQPVYSNAITVHPNFSPNGSVIETLSTDVALIRFAPNTAPANLIVTLASQPPKAGDPVTLVGFGQGVKDDSTSALTKRIGTNTVAITPSTFGTAVVAIRHSGTTDAGNAATYYGDSGGIVYDKNNNGVAIVHDHIAIPAGSGNQVVSATNAIKSASLDDSGTSGNSSGSVAVASGTPVSSAITATGDDIVNRWVNVNDPAVVRFISQQLSMPNTLTQNLSGSGFGNVTLPFAATAPAPAAAPAAAPANGAGTPADDGRWHDPYKSGVSFPYCQTSSGNSGWGYENGSSCKIR